MQRQRLANLVCRREGFACGIANSDTSMDDSLKNFTGIVVTGFSKAGEVITLRTFTFFIELHPQNEKTFHVRQGMESSEITESFNL